MLKIWQLNLVKMPENSSSLSCRAHGHFGFMLMFGHCCLAEERKTVITADRGVGLLVENAHLIPRPLLKYRPTVKCQCQTITTLLKMVETIYPAQRCLLSAVNCVRNSVFELLYGRQCQHETLQWPTDHRLSYDYHHNHIGQNGVF